MGHSARAFAVAVVSRCARALWCAVALVGCAVPREGEMEQTKHLFVATLDGLVRAVALDDRGAPATTVAAAEVGEPVQFLAFHPSLPIVYALGDRSLFALAWRQEPAALTALGAAAVGIRGTHVAVDRAGRNALVASYGGSAVTLLPLGADGLPGAPLATLGSRDDPTFRNAHQIRVHPAGRAVHVPCLGADHVATLVLDATTGSLQLIGTATTHDGAGPRHLDYHPSAPFAFVVNELASSVTTFRVDAGLGVLTPVDTVSTLPAGATSASRSSDLRVTPDGRFLFAVNREPLDDIVSFAIDVDGRLSEVGRVPTGGHHARTIAIDARGSRIWVGNTKSNDVTTFAIGVGGALTRVPGTWSAGAEVYCVLAR